MSMIIQDHVLKPEGRVEYLVVMLHGIGADGENLLPLAADFADVIPNAYFTAPDAPEKYIIDDAFVGHNGYQWFPLWGKSLPELIAGADKATESLKKYIDELLQKLSLDYSRLILIGFSQGCLMAVHAALALPQKCCAVVGYSGAIISESHAISKPDVCLVHGENDDVVPYQQTVFAERKLKAIGVHVESHLLPSLGHWIEERGINIGKEFLKKRIDK